MRDKVRIVVVDANHVISDNLRCLECDAKEPMRSRIRIKCFNYVVSEAW